ncbi:MAG: anion permease [Halobacteria archaeon]
MAWTIGANSNSAPFGPAVGANVLSILRAALLVGVFASLGAILQGSRISKTIGNGLIHDVAITPLASACILLTAATLITIGNLRGYPVPAAFTITGGVIGVGLALGGAPAYDKYREIAGFWLVIPVIAASVGYTTARILRNERIPEKYGIGILAGLVGAVVANMKMSLIPSETGNHGTIARYVAEVSGVNAPNLMGYNAISIVTTAFLATVSFLFIKNRVERSMDKGVRLFLVVLGGLVVFSSGGSQVGLATGPLESVFENSIPLPPEMLIIAGGLMILVGAWTGSPRVVQSVSREYSQLGNRRSISALVPAFLISQTAITLGLPVSTNETIISSLIGSGLVAGSAGISGRKIGYTVVIWLASLALAGGIGAVLYKLLSNILGVT